jgi:glycosyltransferase involved in cell wall biosynthesis
MPRKLAIITTHPIQYYAPMFRILAKYCDLKVFYTWGIDGVKEKYDPDFKKSIAWDIPLLDGYVYEFLENIAPDPGSQHFNGIDNPTIVEHIKEFNPNAILVYGWAYKSHLKVIRYFKGRIPLWFRGDSNLLDKKAGFKNYIRFIFLTWVYYHIDIAFYVGTANKSYYRRFGLTSKQLIFAPHAIDNNRFSANHREEAQQIRKSLNILPEETLILFVGKMEKKKDPRILLSAFTELKNTNAHLLFVGDGELREELEAVVTSENLPATIHFMDFQNQSRMPIIYQSCDLFCLPSKGPEETWGLAVNEAMAAGKAILVANVVGCASDLVKNERNGYIFEAGNLGDLKNKLTSLLADKCALNEMGRESAKVIKEWSIEMQAKIIIEQLNK